MREGIPVEDKGIMATLDLVDTAWVEHPVLCLQVDHMLRLALVIAHHVLDQITVS